MYKAITIPATEAHSEDAVYFDSLSDAMAYANEMELTVLWQWIADSGLTDGYWAEVKVTPQDERKIP